jgi:hypothetical protein
MRKDAVEMMRNLEKFRNLFSKNFEILSAAVLCRPEKERLASGPILDHLRFYVYHSTKVEEFPFLGTRIVRILKATKNQISVRINKNLCPNLLRGRIDNVKCLAEYHHG